MPYVPSEKTDGKSDDRTILDPLAKQLADGIAKVSEKYKYDGAFLGELNYALTRLLQHLPRALMQQCKFKDETRYWLQAGLFGVFLDVVLEYKRRVNTSYEAAQIVKSGDCYDTPYYTRLVEVVRKDGTQVGFQEIMLKRGDDTLCADMVKGKIILE